MLDTLDPRKIRADGRPLAASDADRFEAWLSRHLRRERMLRHGIAGAAPGAAATLNGAPAGQEAPAALIPFIRAAHEHVEGPFEDRTTTVGANAVARGPVEVPAYGYMRAIWLLVEGSGGVLGAGVLGEDAPYSFFDEINLLDVNGANIIGPISGFDLYLINRYGGYAWDGNPANFPGFSNTVNPVFALRVPVEVTAWDGFGSLANQNSSAAFKLRYTIAASTTVFTIAPTTPPDLRVRAYLEAWSQPEAADLMGNAQATRPPHHGAVQYWSYTTTPIVTGDNTIRFTRVGNWVRNWILVYRDDAATPVRSGGEGELPANPRILWDAREWKNEALRYRRGIAREVSGYGTENGVVVYPFTHDQDGKVGNESRDLWVPTTQSSRIEFRGSFGGTGGTLRILTNDIATPGGVR